NAITLDGRTAARLSGLGEAIVAQAGGVVTDDALARFEETLELNPADTRAGFFAGLAAAQSGELDLASRTWLASTDGAAQGDPWAEMSRRFIAQAEVQASGEATDGAAPKIDPETAAAVESMDAGEQQAMIADMVDGLDARLREDPEDIEGWLRLIRARVVMGETAKASDSLRTSLTVFADDGAESERLRMLAAELNLALGEGG
ncbi:MAG: c-type cytochrome biogenesis protein CcmI, partial [Pseudomonadota bacterium]